VKEKKRKEQLNPYGVGSQVSTTQKLVIITIGQEKLKGQNI